MLASEVPILRGTFRWRTEHDPPVGGCEDIRQRLTAVKARVPTAIERVGKERWVRHVNTGSTVEYRNRDRRVINRAYYKMHEILLSCALPSTEASVHLCEAPGGFVQCVSDHLSDARWSWRAVTLPGGVPVTSDVSLLPRERGSFVFADVLCDGDDAVEQMREAFPDGVDLVTADGATEMNHERLEEEHFPLALAQTNIALKCLHTGGNFVLKVFECLLPCTKDLVASLSQAFDTVSLIKPFSSRPSNSERYLVCRGFHGDVTHVGSQPLFHAASWEKEYDTLVSRMAVLQIQSLERALASVS
jgi:23S rRNA U2552 (ribose-2'-O)-methylase RlmE/FtsJ